MKKIVVLTGAGISAESGISTFRDANGLWENHDIMEVASIEGWNANPQLVLDFYNVRRAQLKSVKPNSAHYFLANLDSNHDVTIITQNVDDLHERGGSSKIIHLHGELNKVRSVRNDEVTFDCTENIFLGDLAKDGGQLRPHIVWFGEMVPMMDAAIEETLQADIFIIIGTSLQVYPAASLLDYTKTDAKVICIDPNELPINNNVIHIKKSATEGVNDLVQYIK
ncbi:SIR2 family NAD-dependent protein deacylase [Faecalibacter macacae]|uniref:NAD-dependent protein deacylase n=1 Tax=Faecalibacter macacae TaxID=1859289 RepID=A0A3L9M2D6_9FLAO|nr:NAD-dependent deacylase [Faecalibacter macacae]RLZ07317.1 NAD-dependent deacylase [Faecalibacter macacae]